MTGCLLIHGYTGSPTELAPLIDHLKTNTDWELDVPILPGHGACLNLNESTHQQWIETAEKALVALLAKHEKVYLIGFSMGGLIAAYLVSLYKIDKLVLLAAAGKFLPLKQLTLDLLHFGLEAITGHLREDRYYAVLKDKTRALTWQANREFLQLVKLGRDSLAAVQVPVLIAQGLRDGLVPYRTAAYLQKKLVHADSKAVLFEKSRHFLCLGEDRAVLNKIVLEFLREKK